MILWKNDWNQDRPLARDFHVDDAPEIFDFETEEKLRVKNTLPSKTANKPGKVLEFKRKK